MPSAEHDQLVALLRSAPEGVAGDFAEARQRLEAVGEFFPVPPGVEITSETVAGVPCDRHRPRGADDRARILYFHGGSYTAGSPRSHRSLIGRLAAATGLDVVAPDYRLAPEHPHPAALDDARAVFDAVSASDEPVIVAGDSAGGGLAAALAVTVRDRGGRAPEAVVLLSPWLDLSLPATEVDDPYLATEDLAASAAAYGGSGDDLLRPLVSPGRADLGGLPPIYLAIGTAELFLEPARLFVARAEEAGVDLEVEVGEGLIHVWPFVDGLPESAETLAAISIWLKRHI